MNFRITGLSASPFQHLFGQSAAALATLRVQRLTADKRNAFPCRIELRDAEVGEQLLLFNYAHQPAPTPYQSSHAIFVLEGATLAYDRIDEIPTVLRPRTLSLRAFGSNHEMIDADLIGGEEVESLIHRLLSNPYVEYIHAHYAKRGCYAARISRA